MCDIDNVNLDNFDILDEYQNYLISKDGRLIINTYTGKFVKEYTYDDGYVKISLHDGDKNISLYKHRIIAKQFISNPLDKNGIDHIDHNRANNALSNFIARIFVVCFISKNKMV